MKILVVDDDMLAAEMTSAILESVGHDTLIADNALAGLELLGQHADIELVVSDLNMPLVSGIEFYQELCEQGRTLPFIVLTGDSVGSLLEDNPGLAAVLTKDFDLTETLPQAVNRLLQS